jgi:hypothetical protein
MVDCLGSHGQWIVVLLIVGHVCQDKVAFV